MKPYLPLEIIKEILLRLSIENIAICKCICKAWLNLIESDDFVKSHLSKSAPALAVSTIKFNSNRVNVFKLEDGLGLEPFSNVFAKHGLITKFDFQRDSTIQGSANGLLLLKKAFASEHLYVCNPITREFVEICGRVIHNGDRFGFGVSKIGGRPKVVHHSPESGFHVYTLEAGSGSVWRSVEGAPPFSDLCDYSICGAFFSGNLHWLFKSGTTMIPYVCCFDLETERFSKFPAPFMESTCTRGVSSFSYVTSGGWLYGLVDCLCIHYYDTLDDDVIWFSKEHEQVEKRWTTLQLVMEQEPCYGHNGMVGRPYYGKYAMHARLLPFVYGESACHPIKIYRNGGILMLSHDKRFFYYSKEKRNVTEISLFGKMDDDCSGLSSILFTPSFLSLKRNLGLENVKPLKRNLGMRM
ncbi:putative F-box protein At3g16210 [Salvia hispanica]|uniref:putative F-box protein At3g16210 n=1 Tax=Salvia hispanica TaxID=49212 RepID=UPI0020090BC5|nr:putative F-box protein At3g16210 [Salvia hispanica]